MGHYGRNFEIGRTETLNPKFRNLKLNDLERILGFQTKSNLKFRYSGLRFPFVQFQNSAAVQQLTILTL